MYLERRSVHNLPPGAVVISDKDAINYYHMYIYGPKKIADTWPFKYGIGVSSLVSLTTGFWITNHYVRRFRMTGLPSTFFYIFGAGMPSIMALGYQALSIQPDIILQKACTSCVYTKSIIAHNILGVFYAAVPTGLITMLTASLRYSYDIPGFVTIADAKETIKLYKKITQKIYPRILLSMIFNTTAAIWVTSKQYNALEKLNKRLQMQDEKLRELAAEYELKMEKNSE